MASVAEISFHLSWNPFLLLGILVVASAIAYFSYRRPVPPVSGLLRGILTALRALGLACLFLALAEPVLSLITTTEQPPVVATLIDRSQSMTIDDRTGRREEQIRSFLKHDPLKLSGGAERMDFGFAATAAPIGSLDSDSLKFSGSETDIAAALREIRRLRDQDNIQSVVLISDGVVTAGDNPVYDAEDLGLPIIAVGVGDSSEQKDILISDVFANQIGYVDSKIPVDVTVKSIGLDGGPVELSIGEGTTVLQKKTVTTGSGNFSVAQEMEVTPKEEGIHKYTVRVTGVPGELTTKNNSRSFYVKVLKSKLSVLMFAGAPSPDVAFVRRLLALDRNISVTPFIQKGPGRFYEGSPGQKEFSDADCIALIGYPQADASQTVIDMIVNAFEQKKKPVFFLMSRTIDYQKLRLLESILPFASTASPRGERDVVFTLAPNQVENAMFRFTSAIGGDDPPSRIGHWNSLPPIFSTDPFAKTRPESEVLATASVQGVTLSDPLLVARSVNQTKSLAFLGYGIWRWELLVRTNEYHQSMLSSFLSNAVRWLTTREDSRRVIIAAARPFYSAGETGTLTAQVYDQNYSPIDNAEVRVRVLHSGQSVEYPLQSIGHGRYETGIEGLTEGDYEFNGSAVVGTTTIGEDRGRFSAGEMNTEFLQTRMNATLLRQLAGRTGGRFIPITEFQSAHDNASFFPQLTVKEIRHAREFTLWNSAWLLIGTILVFAIEWTLRKRHGML